MSRVLLIAVLYFFQAPFNPYSAGNCVDGQLALWDTPNGRLSCGFNFSPDGVTSPFNRRVGVLWNPGETGAVAPVNGFGDVPRFDCASLIGNSQDPTATEPGALSAFGTLGGVSCIHGDANWLTGKNLVFDGYGGAYTFPAVDNVRTWHGVSNQTPTTMVGSDDPAGHYAGFLYRTVSGEANFKCVSKDNVTQESTDTGVSGAARGTSGANRVGHRFTIIEKSGPAYDFYIDGILKCSHSTHVPSSGILVSQMWATNPADNTVFLAYSSIAADNK